MENLVTQLAKVKKHFLEGPWPGSVVSRGVCVCVYMCAAS